MTIHHSDLRKHFVHPAEFAKVGTVQARIAITGEVIDTILDRILETRNIADRGDVLVTGQRKERYLIKPDVFAARYAGPPLTYTDQDYEPTGTVWGVEWTHKPLTFIAPWGKKMIIEPGDYLCSTNITPYELYRVEAKAFALTYRPVDTGP
jgi:hypothetical protein